MSEGGQSGKCIDYIDEEKQEDEQMCRRESREKWEGMKEEGRAKDN